MYELSDCRNGSVFSLSLDDDLDFEDPFYFDDVELIYDLDGATASDATPGQLVPLAPVTLSTLHDDIQLLTVTILMIYAILFVLFITRKWR